jgi:hypothetical protein
MKQLTEQQIIDNWKELRGIINDTFSGDRLEKLNKMYVEHILHVIKFSQQVRDTWEQNGAEINFTNEELIFAALHHDLGKIGDLEEDYYVPEESDWHRKNQGSIFTHNPKLQYMVVTDRAFFILQHFGIKMSEWEYIGLMLTDGMYEEANKKYLTSFNPDFRLKSNIAYILHQADMMATHIESDQWRRGDEVESNKVAKSVDKIKKAVDNEVKEKFTKSTDPKDIFNELFGEPKK